MTNDFSDVWQSRMMNNYGTPRIELVKGEGAVVTDSEGREYLDLLAGIAVNVLGHAHPAIVEAVSAQIGTLGHVSNIFASEPSLELAGKLIELTGWAPDDSRVMFCNSGTEANEAAFKLSRLTGRRRVIATHHGFHGRTMGALAGQARALRPDARRRGVRALRGHRVPHQDHRGRSAEHLGGHPGAESG